MTENIQERLKCGATMAEAGKLHQEESEITGEMKRMRVEISKVDRKIRSAEAEGEGEVKERQVREMNEEEEREKTARRATEYADALGQARQKAQEEEQKIRQLEAALKEVGRG